MKKRACPIDFKTVSIDELNKALAFYYGKAAYVSELDGGTLHYEVEIDLCVIDHLAQMTKSLPTNKQIDRLVAPEPTCCDFHHPAPTAIKLDNSTMIFDRYSIECIQLIQLIYIGMANKYFETQHISVPNLIDIDHLQTAGYFDKFPTQAMLVGTLPLQPMQVNHFIGVKQQDPLKALDLFSEKKYALNPVTCYHVYSNFGRLYEQYQAYSFTVEGKAHRYEGKNVAQGRLIEFNMSELVFLENSINPIQVSELIQFYKDFFVRLHLPIEFITSSDAFFTVDAKLHAQLQERSLSKIELICRIENKNLALGSINNHHDYFVKRFHLADQGVMTTKCTGIGLERVLIALQFYHPNQLKEFLNHAYSIINQEYSYNGSA